MRQQKRDNEHKRWLDVSNLVRLTYNHKDKHSAIKVTPADARKPDNQLQVKQNIEMQRVRKRKYPDIEVGDYVRVYKNKTNKLDKERAPVWTTEKFKVEAMNQSMGQPFHKLNGRPREVIRSELLLIK